MKNHNLAHLKTVEPVALDQLRQMHTGSLLARLDRLRALPTCIAQSDSTEAERNAVARLIVFKDTEIWQTAFNEVKNLLSAREHIPKGGKTRRQEDARQKKHR